MPKSVVFAFALAPTRRKWGMPHLALVIAVTFWASSAIAIKVVISGIPIYEAVAFRYLIAAIVLWIITALTGQLSELRRMGWRPLAVGLIEPGIVSIIAYNGILLTTAVHATVIFTLMPLISSVLGRGFLNEEISPSVIVGAVIGLLGTVILVAGLDSGEPASLSGDLLIILAVVLICFAQLTLRRVAQQHGHPALMTALMMTGGAISGMALMAFLGEPNHLAWIETASPRVWLWFLYTAVLVSATSFLFTNYALRHLPVGRVQLYSILTAPIGVPMAWIVLGENVTSREIIAITIIVVGVTLPAITGGIRSRRTPPR
tara:strand:- start:1678 stop:2631 length:954 start_codon:yes stop_codon:yes gene_type:complete